MSGQKGFTLLELLVVVSIVALLASIMLPALGKAKAQVKDTICESNLRQLGQIFKMYADDNGGQFMERGSGYSEGAVSWFHCIRRYHDANDGLIFCPLATATLRNGGRNPYMAWENTTDFGAYYEGSYGINLYVAKRPGDPDFWGTPYVKESPYVPLLTCSQWKDIQPFPSDEPLIYESLRWTPGPYNEMRRPCIKRHEPYYVNVLWLDFTVSQKTIKELWRIKWSRDWPSDYPLPIWPAWMADVPEP
ncbi:MAG: type II secretion system protein [Planctomycetota bacterium]|jgi:prepilin-type N-terminal cleavage/methylation domain-containing protein